MPSTYASHSLRAACDAELARQRTAYAGLAFVHLPKQPVYSNDPKVEARRCKEYDALQAQCEAEAAVWNTEARRWRAERDDIAAALVRLRADVLVQGPGGLVQADDDDADDGSRLSEQDPVIEEEEEQAAKKEDPHASGGWLSTLGATDMLSCDAGLATPSALWELADRQIAVNAAVVEARERARWLGAMSARRQAIASVCEEQKAAFVNRWRHAAEMAQETLAHECMHQDAPEALTMADAAEGADLQLPASSEPDASAHARAAEPPRLQEEEPVS